MKFGSKELYIAKKIGIEIDDYGNQIPYFDKAIRYEFSYMPISSQIDYQIYGADINNMFSSIIDISYLGKIKIGDIAYLIDSEIQDIKSLVNLDKLSKYKQNANYRVKSVQPQNMKLKIIFEKKIGGK